MLQRTTTVAARAVGTRALFSTTSSIQNIKAREIIDSRGNPTVEVDVKLNDGTLHRASVPSGASTGKYEAVEKRDGESRYLGKGVLEAVNNVNEVIAPELGASGLGLADQKAIDDLLLKLDGTENKAKLGANAILGVSLAIAKAGAHASGVPLYQHFANLAGKGSDASLLPVPFFNVINGGSHAGNKLPVQEFMILPSGADTFREAMAMGCEVYQTLKGVIKEKYGLDATNVGDEGGFAPNVNSAQEALELLELSVEQAGYTGKIEFALDVAASEMYHAASQGYDLNFKYSPEEIVTREELQEMYKSYAAQYPLVSIEDPFDEDDWSSYSSFTADVGESLQIVGDDLLVTNPKKIQNAIESKACNALLLKVNQIGSVSESIEAVLMSQNQGWGVMTSHRSGETEDSYIADLAVGLATGQIKTGAPCRSERLSKYNQLLRIEEELGDKAKYAGKNFRNPQ